MAPELDVFLSHSQLDDELASDVKRLLEHNHIKVFSTPESIVSGKWEEQIEEALQQSSQVWVLLTPNALKMSVWVHQEIGYFYGFRHGRNEDSLGDASNYLYEDGTLQPGLYAHLQGTKIENTFNPSLVAETIATRLGRQLEVPSHWDPSTTLTDRTSIADSDEKFNAQLRDLESQVPREILNGGHYLIAFHPESFTEQKIADITLLDPTPVRRIGSTSRFETPSCRALFIRLESSLSFISTQRSDPPSTVSSPSALPIPGTYS